MPSQQHPDALGHAREFFSSGRTADVSWTKGQLASLLSGLERYEQAICEALRADLGKPLLESYATEILPVKVELRHVLRKLKRWRSPRRVASPWWLLPARCWVQPEPYGAALILSPWNLPIQLSLMPLVAALAAGNTAVLKPSEVSPHCAEILRELISSTLEPGLVTVVCGEASVAADLSQQPFDFVFFTGGEAIGRRVAEAAGRNLTPCVLELGGKNPCIVTADAPLEITARRIVWAKCLNAGQTCLAPDHVLVEESMEKPLLEAMSRAIRTFYGEDASQSPDYGRIVNERHLRRLIAYLDGGTVAHGGRYRIEDRYMEPTIMTGISPNAAISEQEIFGPILPVYSFKSLDSLLATLRERPVPLALYLHTRDRQIEQRVIRQTRSGSLCVNDHIVHATVNDLPFGGSGQSGMGRYHGRCGFDTFSQQRSVMHQASYLDNPLRYPPGAKWLPWIKKLIG